MSVLQSSILVLVTMCCVPLRLALSAPNIKWHVTQFIMSFMSDKAYGIIIGTTQEISFVCAYYLTVSYKGIGNIV